MVKLWSVSEVSRKEPVGVDWGTWRMLPVWILFQMIRRRQYASHGLTEESRRQLQLHGLINAFPYLVAAFLGSRSPPKAPTLVVLRLGVAELDPLSPWLLQEALDWCIRRLCGGLGVHIFKKSCEKEYLLEVSQSMCCQ